MTNKSIRDYINLIENAQQPLTEWMDPGPPCAICGKPSGEHRVQFDRKNPNVSFMDPDEEWNDLKMSNAEDHEFSPVKGYKPLSQREAELVGFEKMTSGPYPDDIYDQINKVRQRIARVGKGAGNLTRVKEEQLEETSPEAIAKINQITRK